VEVADGVVPVLPEAKEAAVSVVLQSHQGREAEQVAEAHLREGEAPLDHGQPTRSPAHNRTAFRARFRAGRRANSSAIAV
jgi:hypothetical protein